MALQIYRETKRFASVLGLRCTAVYGGAQVAQQIADLKRGAEVVVATPGRLIDILTMQQGRLIALSRVSFVVLDEADRMFDMGCEPVWKSFNFWCVVVSLRGRVHRSAIVSEFRETRITLRVNVVAPTATRHRLDAITRRDDLTHGSMSTQVRAANRHGLKERETRSTDGVVFGDVSEGRRAVGEKALQHPLEIVCGGKSVAK